jgi:hypothetical protein
MVSSGTAEFSMKNELAFGQREPGAGGVDDDGRLVLVDWVTLMRPVGARLVKWMQELAAATESLWARETLATAGQNCGGEESQLPQQTLRGSAGGVVEFVEEPIHLPARVSANSTNSTNSTGVHTLEAVVIPAASLVETYLVYARKQVESADSYIVGSFLPLLAACLGRRVYFPWGNERIYPNLFALLAGRSGDRKSSAINLVESSAKAVLLPDCFLPHTCSAESLFNEYDGGCGGLPDKLLLADDANPILGTWTKSGYGERVGQRFLNLYDCKPLFESFEKNRKGGTEAGSRRIIPETSTSVILGATLDICRMQGHGISSGLQRRFLYYAAMRHGRLISCPPAGDQAEWDNLLNKLAKLCRLEGVCQFSGNALALWESYQRQNRTLLQSENDEARLARLNGAPRQVQKIAILFQASKWVEGDQPTWDGIIDPDTLELAVDHVNHCLQTAAQLESIAEKAGISMSSEALLARIRRDFAAPEYIEDRWIILTKTQLTAKYASQPTRPHSWKPDDLYLKFIPDLIQRGVAHLGGQQGKRIWYGFAVDD